MIGRRRRWGVAAVSVALGLAVAAAGCGKHKKKKHHHDLGKIDASAAEDPWVAPGTAAPPSTADCERLPFATSIPVPEASGAAWLHGGDGAGDVVIVIGDSGHGGAYVEIDATTGALLRRGNLPLGEGAGDDVEGLATDGQRLWGLTSAGWLRAWEREGDHFRLVLGPYSVERRGPCKFDDVNCGHDFEGLCLRPAGTVDGQGCVGFAASRAESALFCLTAATVPPEGAGPGVGPWLTLAVREGKSKPHPGPELTGKRALADCAIAGDGAVWTGDNLLGGAMVRRLDAPSWQGALGVGFPEAMALAPDGVVYRFSDAGGSPSLAARYRCPAAKAGPATGALTGVAAAAPSPSPSPSPAPPAPPAP